MDSHSQDPTPAVTITTTRTVTILGTGGKPSIELEAAGDAVKVTLLPRNSTKRDAIKLDDLYDAVTQLRDTPRT